MIQPRPELAGAMPRQRADARSCVPLLLRPTTGLARAVITHGLGWGLVCWLAFCACWTRPALAADQPNRTFQLKGRVEEVRPAEGVVVLAHEAVSNYMAAMVMPFHAKEVKELDGLRRGDLVSCRLTVTADESWVEHIKKTGTGTENTQPVATVPSPAPAEPAKPHHPLLDYPFTNQLGQVVRLSDFHGQALAITFFFTRCPIPQYCPRLSRNFEEVQRKLGALANAPTNWHLVSVTFDPAHDTPAVLRAYAASYHYDPAHWSFLTGPTEPIDELARSSGVTVERESGGLVNHNFRTLIIDAAGQLQMVFPTSGNLSDALVSELLKAMQPPAGPLIGANRP